MGFFENELQKIVGAKSPIIDARYGGRACVGRLGETTNIKLQFVTLGTHEKYEGIKATVFNRNNGEIDSNIFRFADILGKNATKNNLNNNMPYAWKTMNNNYEWYSYKPTATDYSTLAKEINAYLEMFLEPQLYQVNEKAKTLYLLYSCNEWCEKSKALLLLITPDKETLYAAIGGEILTGNMEYIGESGGKGFAEYKKDCLAGVDSVDIFKELNYGFVKEMDITLLSEPETLSEYYASANTLLSADVNFDPDAFDEVYNNEDINDEENDCEI